MVPKLLTQCLTFLFHISEGYEPAPLVWVVAVLVFGCVLELLTQCSCCVLRYSRLSA